MKNDLPTRRKMFREVRNLGFVDDVVQAKTKNIPGIAIFRCIRGDRFLTIQIWTDGVHRVSHGTIKPGGRRIETTPPTEFRTLTEMYRAIAFEWQRPSMKVSP